MTSIDHLPDGARGWDCNEVIGASEARLMKAAGFSFAVRYVKRDRPHAWDVSQNEILSLLNAGLGVMLVQHVAPPGWLPTASLGMIYGETAAEEAHAVGLPFGVNLWCDLEGVRTGASHADTIAFCNEWHEAVERRGFLPGLYVGDQPGLTPTELYRELRFTAYWQAYNLATVDGPIVRGFQMKQHPQPAAADKVPVSFPYQTDTLMRDLKGSSPVLYLP